MIVRKPSSQFTKASSDDSACSSLKPPSVLNDDMDLDDDVMSSAGSSPPSLAVAIPTSPSLVGGPHSPRRPTLRDILSNNSPAPWTLAAFMAYLSHNHCLETLEFIMDAARYRKHYAKMMSKSTDGALPPAKDREYIQSLWERLVEAYIMSNGSREVNLPSSVKAPIIHVAMGPLPPSPETLDPAVRKINELMEESVLVPFLNSFYPQSVCPTVPHRECSDPNHARVVARSTSSESRESRFRLGSSRRSSSSRSTPSTDMPSHPPLPASHPLYVRKSAPAPLSVNGIKSLMNTSAVSLTHSVSSPAAPASESGRSSRTATYSIHAIPAMVDDSTSAESHSYDSASPTTPPAADLYPARTDSKRSTTSFPGMFQKLGSLGRIRTGSHRRKTPGERS